jgi:hypothetical protein
VLSDKGSSVDAMKFPEVDGSSADEMKPSKSLSADGLRSLALKLISPVCSDDPQINTFEDATVVPSTPRGVELTPSFLYFSISRNLLWLTHPKLWYGWTWHLTKW